MNVLFDSFMGRLDGGSFEWEGLRDVCHCGQTALRCLWFSCTQSARSSGHMSAASIFQVMMVIASIFFHAMYDADHRSPVG